MVCSRRREFIWRAALGVALLAFAFSAAAYLHRLQVAASPPRNTLGVLLSYHYRRHPGWADALAAVVVLAGVAGAVAAIGYRRQRPASPEGPQSTVTPSGNSS
jgi:hypothetical protein